MSDNPSVATQFKPGNAGGRGGKTKEARDRISRAFLYAFADDFEEHGAQAIVDLREKDVASYVKVAVALQPKEHEHRHVLENVDDTQLNHIIEHLQGVIAERAERVQH